MANNQDNNGLSYLGDEDLIGHENTLNSTLNNHDDFMYYQSTSPSFDGYKNTNYNSKSQILNTEFSFELSANPLGNTLPSFSSIRPTFNNSSVDHVLQNFDVNEQNGPLFQSCVNSVENQTTNLYGIELAPKPTNILNQVPGHSSWDNDNTVPVENQTTNLNGHNSSFGLAPGHSSLNHNYSNPMDNRTTNLYGHNSSFGLDPEPTDILDHVPGHSGWENVENQTTNLYGNNSSFGLAPEPTDILDLAPGHSSWDNNYSNPVENHTTNNYGHKSSTGLTPETPNYLHDAIPGHSSWNSSYTYPVHNHTTNNYDHTRSSIGLAPGTTNYLGNDVGHLNSISSGIPVYNRPSNSLNNCMQSLAISGNSNYEVRPETTMGNPGNSGHELNPPDYPFNTKAIQRLPAYIYNTFTEEQKKERRNEQHSRSSQKHYKKKKEEVNQLKREDESLKISIADKESKKATLEKKIDIMEHYLQKKN